jgi:hypothetical protein
MVTGALWREDRLRDLLAWHAVNVMNGSGAKTKGGGPITMETLLGRAPTALKYYFATADEAPTPESEPSMAAPSPAPPPVDPIRFRLEELERRGFQVKRVA